MVSQAAAIGSNTLFPYTHGKNPQIKTQSASAWEITRPHKTKFTNGLLRQFFPKGSDVELDKAVALQIEILVSILLAFMLNYFY